MRIYITSRNRTPSSASPSDFQFALERPIELPEGARGTIDSFTCSNVWEAVLAGCESDPILPIQLPIPATLAPLVLEPGDITSVADLASQIDNRTGSRCSIRASCNVTASGNRLIFDCPGLGVGQTLHSCLAPDPELRPFSVYATSGGVGRCLRPGGSDDQGHSMYTSRGCRKPHCCPDERPPHKPDGQP